MLKLGPSLGRRAYLTSTLSSNATNKRSRSFRLPFYPHDPLRQYESEGNTDAAGSPFPPGVFPPGVFTLRSGEEATQQPEDGDDILTAHGDGDSGPSKPKDRSSYGSGSKRAMRNLKSEQPKDLPRPQLPSWYLKGKVRLREEPGVLPNGFKSLPPNSDLSIPQTRSNSKPEGERFSAAIEPTSADTDSVSAAQPAETESPEEVAYGINNSVWEEVTSLVSAGLQVPPSGYKTALSTAKPHLLLQCPQTGSADYLDTLVDALASSNAADRIRIDGQDIEEAFLEYLSDDEDVRWKLRTLSYEAYQPSIEARKSQERDEEYEEDGNEDIGSHPSSRSFSIPKFQNLKIIPKVIASFAIDGHSPPGFQEPFPMGNPPKPDSDVTARVSLLVEAFIEAGEAKRKTLEGQNKADIGVEGSQNNDGDGAATEGSMPNPAISKTTIIAIKEYQGIKSNSTGAYALAKLQEVVEKRRSEGQQILIIGTSTGSSALPTLSKSAIQSVQADMHSEPYRTIIMPCSSHVADGHFAREKKLQILQINMRNLRMMLYSSCPNKEAVKSILYTPTTVHFKKSQLYASYMDEQIWPQHQIHRWAAVALGIANGHNVTPVHIEEALTLILGSDEIKFEWVEELRTRATEAKPTFAADMSSAVSNEERMDKLKKECNSHEKKLLPGVVDPTSIRTTFSDVRAEALTIDTLKMLTTLAMVRPDAFTYGVLARERIPGALLFGPPGTGKTLLAKAVAKESGATVLEVDGSTVYDMYVGEGEKNVKAIFSLAKKLTPCIIFIDEADAILGTRTGSANRTSHRELINQFLREWDGMNETSAFIMVATNRPYDLDEACLRRLPRRILVDLPTEEDREAILNIHLKDEILAPEVSISKLAAQTPLYSGSDLKNLSVAAALGCVREEVNNATVPASGERRTLYQRHFDRALEEISASISEDMSSLSAIRKFDEKYGDRKGKRRKTASVGFGTIKEGERNLSDLARVRNYPRSSS